MSQGKKSQLAWSESKPTKDQGVIEAAIQDGWLHARRADVDGQLRWHVILGRAGASALPSVKVEGGISEVRHANGRYFVREMLYANRLSCIREKVDRGSFAGIETELLDSMKAGPRCCGGGVEMKIMEERNWMWVLLGPEGGGRNAVVRMTPTILVPENSVSGAYGVG